MVDFLNMTRQGELDLDPKRWPDPAEMNRQLHAMNVSTLLSVWPHFAPGTLLLLAGFLVMLGRVPIGDQITHFLPEGHRLSNLSDWIMNVPNKAGQRAIMIGIALGTVSTSLRLILGIEKSHLGGEG